MATAQEEILAEAARKLREAVQKHINELTDEVDKMAREEEAGEFNEAAALLFVISFATSHDKVRQVFNEQLAMLKGFMAAQGD